MNLTAVISGSSVFIDANIFVYAYAPDPQYGPFAADLLLRVQSGDVKGYCSSHVLSDVAHRLMTLEACNTLGRPYAGIAARLARHPDDVKRLTRFRDAVAAILTLGIVFLPVGPADLLEAATMSQQFGVLTNDALIVALMRAHSLQQIASFDSDFDGIPGIVRFSTT